MITRLVLGGGCQAPPSFLPAFIAPLRRVQPGRLHPKHLPVEPNLLSKSLPQKALDGLHFMFSEPFSDDEKITWLYQP